MIEEAVSTTHRMTRTLEKKQSTDLLMILPIFALCIDFFTPYLIWQNFLPAWVRWGSHLAIAAMIAISFFWMLGFKQIPRSIWLILAVSILWSYIAMGRGQGITATAWGIWLLFQFPFVCIFMYLQSNLPKQFFGYLRKYGITVFGMQVLAQLLQYASGVTPGDDLSGLFGRNGTGSAVIFALLINCIFLGYWIMSKKWIGLVIALTLGAISSALGEMKLFAPAIATISLLAVVLYAIKYRAPGKMLIFSILIYSTLVGFISLYNIIVPSAQRAPIENFITDPAKLSEYLNSMEEYTIGGNIYADIGRGYAVQLGWKSLQKDLITFLFGYGIGSRSESQSLQTVGVALKTGGSGISVGTSLLVMMQEMGVIGLALLAAFWLWTLLALVHDIRAYPTSPAVGLRYALFLFSILWPLWLWYATIWTMRVPMLLYWMLLGYAMAESKQSVAKIWLDNKKGEA